MLKSIYFIDGPFKGSHDYADKLQAEVLKYKRMPLSKSIRPGEYAPRYQPPAPITYYLIDDPSQDLLEYRYSIRKPE